MSRLTLIVAATKSNGIGQNGHLPWSLPKEMGYFARVTTNAPSGLMNSAIMGRRSWESIPNRFRPLKERINVVISRSEDYELFPSTVVSSPSKAPTYLTQSLASAITRLSEPITMPIHRHFIIGGALIYKNALTLTPKDEAFVDRILLTRITEPAFDECDVFITDFLGQGSWERAKHEELSDWVGFHVPEGVQEENGVKYEFQMWIRQN